MLGYMESDMELSIYRGRDYSITDGLVIRQPTLGEIEEYGENRYFSMIHNLTSAPADLKWQLDDLGVDYTTLTDWELFYNSIYRLYSQSQTQIILGELDLGKFELCKENDAIVLYNKEDDYLINECIYLIMSDFLRKMHGLKRNDEMPGNESTKRILIEDAREDFLIEQNKEHHSYLKNLISTMVNSEGFKYNHDEVWNVKINAFLDSVKRISRITNAKILLQSGYSGFGIDLKKIDNKEIQWQGEL